jgi:hypothetical protein
MNLNEQDIERIRQEMEAEHQKDLDALARVAEIVARRNSGNTSRLGAVSSAVSGADQSSKGKGKRAFGLRKAGRKVFSLLPDSFDRRDLAKALERNYPQIAAEMSDASIRGVLESFVKEGFAEVTEKGAGKRASKYRKLQSEILRSVPTLLESSEEIEHINRAIPEPKTLTQNT